MVWARTKLTIWEYCWERNRFLTVYFTGPHPDKFYKKIKELMSKIFNVPEGYIQEVGYNWERGENSERFKLSWEIMKVMDNLSFLKIDVDLKGESIKGEGTAKIEIEPVLITEYPQDTIFQRNIIYEMFRRFWHKMFYDKKRIEYIDLGRKLTTQFEQELKRYGEELKKSS